MDKAIYPDKCRNGHKLTDKSVYIAPNGKKWRCRACLKACCKKYRTSRRQALVESGYKPYDPARRVQDTECRKGHPWTPENTYVTQSNPKKRQCKACRNARNKAKRLAGSIQVLHQLYPEDGFI